MMLKSALLACLVLMAGLAYAQGDLQFDRSLGANIILTLRLSPLLVHIGCKGNSSIQGNTCGYWAASCCPLAGLANLGLLLMGLKRVHGLH